MVLTDASLSATGQAMETAFGLRPKSIHHYAIKRALHAMTTIFSISMPEAIALLSAPPYSDEVMSILAHYVTIGETYFFRHQEHFDFLEHEFFPALIAKRRNQGRKGIRIWSAGCSTGEEPYSLAIALRRMIPDIDTWDVKILATDINPESLRLARQANYGQWSFRGVGEDIKQQYFSEIREHPFSIPGLPHETKLRLHGEIARIVDFSELNLTADRWVNSEILAGNFDLIVCRNVLMYFSKDRIESIFGKFYTLLSDSGMLLVGPSESWFLRGTNFVSAKIPKLSAFYKQTNRAQPEKQPEKIIRGPASDAGFGKATHYAPRRTPRARAEELPRLPLAKREETPTILETARELADNGHLDQALESTEKAISKDKTNPELHYLHAVILMELSQNARAEQSLRRALFLQPDMVSAHIATATLAVAGGRPKDARRHYANALEWLSKMEDSETVPDSDGMPAGALKEMINTLLGKGE